MRTSFRGYAEGYYGRLLSWQDRLQILDTLQRLALNTYYYAPKEDPWHRFSWRTPYEPLWRQDFSDFCAHARMRGIRVVAGVAPGLDFDFSQLPDGDDFRLLKAKCEGLLIDGADAVSLLMDDIDPDFSERRGGFISEGVAHASLANALGVALQASSLSVSTGDENQGAKASLWVTPRIYADELIAESPNYLESFVHTLEPQHYVVYCGSDVVAHEIDELASCRLQIEARADTKHQVIFWDNLYANDYCPRRLFVGPWLYRHSIDNVVLNPTGMVNTDCLLLELMADSMLAREPYRQNPLTGGWRNVLLEHKVPEQFFEIAEYFRHPVFNNDTDNGSHHKLEDNETVRAAIEHCLWCWKAPLAREWYPFIFGLKHDLLTLSGEHPSLRIGKTQPRPLSDLLIG